MTGTTTLFLSLKVIIGNSMVNPHGGVLRKGGRRKLQSGWVVISCAAGHRKLSSIIIPFGIEHDEEQHITNPKAKILLDYNATEDEPNPRKFAVATYELDYKKGKVISLSIYTRSPEKK